MTSSRRGRPLGEISLALLAAAEAGGPSTLVQLAQRSQVGYDSARFKVKYLVQAGALNVLTSTRPHLYALPSADACTAPPDCGGDLAAAWFGRTHKHTDTEG